MDPESPEAEAAEAQAREAARLAQLHEAYLNVFGGPESRTPFGALILADLEVFTRFSQETISMDTLQRVDPYKTIYRDGKQAVVKRIHMRINWSPP